MLAKLAPADYFARMVNPPRFFATDSVFVSVFYDNLVAGFKTAKDRDDFERALCSVTSSRLMNVSWKTNRTIAGVTLFGPNKYSSRDMKQNASFEKLPIFLGMQFAFSKRDADGSSVLCWRHNPKKIENGKRIVFSWKSSVRI